MSNLVFTSHPNSFAGVKGVTPIHHKLRLKLNISYEEYCMVDFFHDWNIKHPDKKATFDDLQKVTGVQSKSEVKEIVDHLYEKKILEKSLNPTPCKAWQEYFSTDESFEKLWATFEGRGTKATALTNYQKVVKQVDKDVLQVAAEKYVATSGKDWTFRKHLSAWLNPEKKHWENQTEKPSSGNTENRLSINL